MPNGGQLQAQQFRVCAPLVSWLKTLSKLGCKNPFLPNGLVFRHMPNRGADVHGQNASRFGSFFVLCFSSTWRTVSPDALLYQDLGHTQTPRICHNFVLSLLVLREHSPPKCLFFMANAKLPNRPGLFIFLQKGDSKERLKSGTICPFGVFSPVLQYFCFKIGHFPFKT